MREIKFRAWDKGNKQWLAHYGVTFFVSGKALCINDENVEVIQYTGLKDKNGKEIYEGDIVSWLSSRSIAGPNVGRVYFDQDKVGFYIEEIKSGTWVGAVNDRNALTFYDWDGPEFEWDELEIIGNQYENPDLLKP